MACGFRATGGGDPAQLFRPDRSHDAPGHEDNAQAGAWGGRGSNPRASDYESGALTTELPPRAEQGCYGSSQCRSQTFFDQGLIGGLASHVLYAAIAGEGPP